MDIPLFESALRDDSLPRIPKQVLLYLIFRCGESYKCWPAQNTIAKQLKYRREHISKAIAYLREKGFILTEHKGKILSYDLLPVVTCYQRSQHVLPVVTRTCDKRSHRTSIKPANEVFADANGLKYTITAEKTRRYL